MLDIKLIRENPEMVKAAMKTRNKDMDAVVDDILDIDAKRRELMKATDALKQEQNAASKKIPQIKKDGGDISEIMARMNEIKSKRTTLRLPNLMRNRNRLSMNFRIFLTRAFRLARTTAKTLKFVVGVSRESSILNTRHTGISALISVFLIPKQPQKLQEHVFTSIKASVQNLKEQLSTFSSIPIQSTVIRKFFLRSL